VVQPAAGPERAPHSTQTAPELPAGLRLAPDGQVDAQPVLPGPELERAPLAAVPVQRRALEPRRV
jgi:hypothetical protein